MLMSKTRYSLVLTLILLLSACTSDNDVGVSDEGEDSSGGDLVASYAIDAASLDPAGQNDLPSDQRRNVLYEGLLYLNDDLEPEPRLATEYEQIDDTTWQFTLREGVTFHDGTAFNADAVKASIERILDPAVGSSRANIFEMIESINVVDDHTLEFVTEYPFASLPNYLTHDGGGIVSKAVIDEDYQNAIDEAGVDITVDEYYELREADNEAFEDVVDQIGEYTGAVVEQKPTGTGYMQLESRTPGESIVMERFDDYWDEPANLDTITFKVVPESSSRIAELETGDAHFTQGFDHGQWDRVNDSPDMEGHPVYNISNEYIGFNTQNEYLDDKRVRQAIAHMVDKEAVLEGIYYDTGRVMKGALQEEVLGYNEDLEDLQYDPEHAQELLEKAGLEDGFELTVMVNGESQENVDLAIFLQETLQDIGITLNVEQLEWGAYIEAISNGEHDLFILGWPNSVGDPDQGLLPLFHSTMIGEGGNRTFFENDEVDELLEAGRTESDAEEREAIYQEVEEILVEEQPLISVRQAQSANAQSTDVEGLYINHFNKPDFRNVTLSE